MQSPSKYGGRGLKESKKLNEELNESEFIRSAAPSTPLNSERELGHGENGDGDLQGPEETLDHEGNTASDNAHIALSALETYHAAENSAALLEDLRFCTQEVFDNMMEERGIMLCQIQELKAQLKNSETGGSS
ncbi:hypothetical protein FRB93_002103 [Tulasnella sp. JGI-2019a]|nr:hypothetical protein FRB93_002103 [Tulasnella sp. JGI-2019a]